MKLSEVPLAVIVTDENWLISDNTGKYGKVVSVNVSPYGRFFGITIIIQWEDGNTSYADYPEQCNGISINPDWIKDFYILSPFANYHIGYLGKQISTLASFKAG